MSGSDGELEVFGLEELEKQFERTIKKFPDKTAALLKAQANILKKETSNRSPVLKSKRSDRKPGQLKSSWRALSPKEYENAYGSTLVVRVQSNAPHGHLVEDGHEIVSRERKRDARGRYAKESYKLSKTNRLTATGRKVFGVKSGGRVKGKDMLKDSLKKLERSFYAEAEKMLNDLTEDYE